MPILAYLRPGSDGFLLALGVAALVCLAAGPVALLAMISIIGLPLALAMAAIPPIFVVLLTARLVAAVLGSMGIRSRILSLVLALAVLAVVPWQVNARLDRRAADLVAGDLPGPLEQAGAASLAIRTADHGGFGRDDTGCDDLCLRVLLGGRMQRVLVAGGADVTRAPDPATPATSFRLEQRPQCPPVRLRAGMRSPNPPPERPAVDPTHRMRLAIAQGTCLIAEPASLGEAETVLSLGPVAKGKTAYAAGLDPVADTVRADRLEVHRRDGAAFAGVLRRTFVQVDRLAPILVPSYVPGSGLELKAGLIRIAGGAASGQAAERRPDLAAALTTALGLDLSLPQTPEVAGPADVLGAALTRPGPVDDTIQDIARDLFEGFMRQPARLDAPARALATRILADARFPVNRYAWTLVRHTDDPAALDDLARILFARLRMTDPALRDREVSYLGYPAGNIGTAIAALPPAAVRSHRDDLEWLARQRDLRVPAWPALKQLHVFGADAVATLLFLIDDAGDPKTGATSRGNAWQHPYLAGLIGLCLAGRGAEAAATPLLDRLARGRLVTTGSYRRLLVHTLVAIGSDPVVIWSALGDPDAPEARQRFDRDVEHARRRADCSY